MENILDDTYIIEYDANGHLIFFKNASGWWWKKEYDECGNMILWEDSSSMWIKKEYDAQGNVTRYQNYLGIDITY